MLISYTRALQQNSMEVNRDKKKAVSMEIILEIYRIQYSYS